MPSPRQIPYIFNLARQRGMDVDEVRAMTPNGSISKMSTQEASILIDALKRGVPPDYSQRPRGYHKRPVATRRPRKRKGVVRYPSTEQAKLWCDLVKEIRTMWGWTSAEMGKWLSKRRFKGGGPMNRPISSNDIVEGIEFLKIVRIKARRAIQSRQRSATRETVSP